MNSARIIIDAMPRLERKRSIQQMVAELRPKLAQVPGIRAFPVIAPPISIAGRPVAQPVSVHAAGHRHRGALQVRAAARREDEADPRGRGRQQRPRAEEPADHHQHRPREGGRARAERHAGRDGAVQRVRLAAGVADLRAQQSVPGHPAGRSRVPEGPERAVDALRQGERRRELARPGEADSAEHAGDDYEDHRTDRREPLRAAAVGHDRVQQRRGLRARRRRQRDSGGGQRHPARDDCHQVPGHGAGVPGFAAGHRPHPRDGDRRHLHRARDPLRELHPPDHHPVGPAVGRVRRPPDAVPLQDGDEPLRDGRASSCSSAS